MLCFGNNNEEGEQQPAPKLNIKNYLNVVFYILNIIVTFGIGTLGWSGQPTNGELSEKYQVRLHKILVLQITLSSHYLY